MTNPNDGLFDTNILIHWPRLRAEELPDRAAISTVTIAELSAGVHATDDPAERANRLELLQRTESAWDPIPFDIAAARAYGRIAAGVAGIGRSVRSRVADQMIAAIAASRGLRLYTTNPGDYAGLDALIEVIAVNRPAD